MLNTPFDLVAEGYTLVYEGGTVMISAGSYPENLHLSKYVTLKSSGGIVVIGGQK
jgi:hypothetical protein